MEHEELARIGASAPRRMIGVGALVILGALLLLVAMGSQFTHFGWQLFLIACGLLALWMSQMMWRATAHSLILTEEGLFEDSGEVLARIDNIAKVDRTPFAMKPSNGFLLILKEPMPRAWRPGLWWRGGRRVAVGGVTSGGQTKPVADILTLRLSERQDGE